MIDAPEAAVLLVAHGSRVQTSNQEVVDLAGRLAENLAPGQAATHAFLEMAQPSIPEAIDTLVDGGAPRIVLIPYFLSAGRHVIEDIPALVDAARRRHPGVAIEVTGHFGAQQAVPQLLSAMINGNE